MDTPPLLLNSKQAAGRGAMRENLPLSEARRQLAAILRTPANKGTAMSRRIARKLVSRLPSPFRLELVRAARDLEDFLEPGKYRERIFQRVATAADGWLRTQMIAPRRQDFDVAREVREFFDDYRASPFREPHGGSRIGNLLWLDLLAKAFAPDVMVDSGRLGRQRLGAQARLSRGASSQLRHRPCPDCCYAFNRE